MDEGDDNVRLHVIQKRVEYAVHSISSLEDQFGHEAQEDPDIGNEEEVEGVDGSQTVDETTLTLD